MHTIYIDADACPVKDEIYRVAKRYAMPVIVVANSTMGIPTDPLVSIMVTPGFGAADDWIVEVAGAGDIAITADIPLAARCVAKGVRVINTKGFPLTDANVGEALALRNLHEELRQSGAAPGGPSPMTPKDRSRFLAKLDETIVAVRKTYRKEESGGTASP
jgi:uncharacterized protein YaiI (UPF0178 family)